ncbi:MAG: inositol monophosphatase [Clostridia bacterium]|nr:inositol monophosphatase [Clostridia bacterium]
MTEAIIRRAGEMIRSHTASHIYGKSGQANFATDMDLEIQRYLFGELKRLYGDCGFYGEEDTEGNDHDLSGRCFIIDPIDGTTNYMFGYNASCVSVGMSVNGVMAEGYVYDPYTDEFFRAEKGKGAWLNGRRLVMRDRGIEDGLVAFGCAHYNGGDDWLDAMFRIIKEIYLKSMAVRSGGSAAIDLCRVARGANVGYIEMMLQPYDYAAAAIIIEEAGGVIRQVDGRPITLDRPCSILAGTRTGADQIRAIALRELA